MQPRWRVDGFAGAAAADRRAAQPARLQGRHRQPGRHRAERDGRAGLGQLGSGEPAWAAGGSYQVVRVIRMLVEFWDRVDDQRAGADDRPPPRHRRAAVRPARDRPPDYADDPLGATIPLDAHIRLANPRTAADRRAAGSCAAATTTTAGIDVNGNLDMGLVFTCFQQDLDRQFVAVQKRLAGEPLVDYISPGRRRLLLRAARRPRRERLVWAGRCSPDR